MSLFVDRDDPDQPQTHALVIGVGDYPHLRGGKLFAHMPAANTLGLGQLTSSTVSAKAFATWLAEEYTNPRAPLGTVDMLLSPTFAEVRAHFAAWDARCDRHRDGVAMFYYCGHGIQKDVTLLLPSDFGADPNIAFAEAIDFTTTWHGMALTKAKTQLSFLDCCREEPIEALEVIGNPRELKSGRRGARLFDRDAPILRAASIGQRAHGPSGETSFFTTELIRCLRGFAADRRTRNKRWTVTTASLRTAVMHAMGRVLVNATERATCTSDGLSNFTSDLHEIDRANVFASIGCLPPARLPSVTLRVDGPETHERPPAPEPWELELSEGRYDVCGDLIEDGARVRDSDVPVLPPYFCWDLEF